MAIIKRIMLITLIAVIILSVPVAYDRWNREINSNGVDVVIDFDSIVKVASMKINVRETTKQYLQQLKEAGATGVALQETTLDRLNKDQFVTVLSGEDVNKNLVLQGKLDWVDPNNTFVFFIKEYEADLKPLFTQGFEEDQIRSYTLNGSEGIEIALPFKAAKDIPIGLNPVTVNMITTELGMNMIPRLSNKWLETPTSYKILTKINDLYDPYALIFEGEEVLGFDEDKEDDTRAIIAEQLKNENILVANIEFNPQRGMSRLGAGSNYNVVRLHSIQDKEMNTLKTDILSDRIIRGVTERNIRMIYINTAFAEDKKADDLMEKTVDVITLAVKGSESTEGLESDFTMGQATPFRAEQPLYANLLKWVSVIGGLLLTAFMLRSFWKSAHYIVPTVGIIGLACAYVFSSSLFMLALKAIALATAISAPTLAGIVIISLIKNYSYQNNKRALLDTVGLFLFASALTLSGAILVVGMLSHVQFALYLNTFSGVKLLHVAPIALILIYLIIVFKQKLDQILFATIRTYHLLIVGVVGLAGLYYVMRTGNTDAAAVSSVELAFRSTVEQWLGIRPRTKEFLFGHPLWIVATFIALRYPKALYLLVPAIIGQLSMMSTFTHLHSPLWVSAVRTGIGMLFGLLIGFILIGLWQLFVRTKWGRYLLNVL